MPDTNLELHDGSECFLKSSQPNKTSTKLYCFFNRYLRQCQLVIQSILPDLKSFRTWQLVILILFATFNMTFSVLDFNALVSPEQNCSIIKWKNEFQAGVPLWRRILLCLSGLSSITTVLNVVLVIHGKMSSYFWGIVGAIMYGSFAFGFGYVGDAQLYVLFFLPTQFVGIYIWSKQLDSQSTTRVRSLPWSGWIVTILASCFLILFFYHEIPLMSKFLTSNYLFETRPIPHLLDATTNGLSVVGQILLVACYWEQYILWTFVNLMLIVMYSGSFQTTLDINLLVVWIMLTCNSSCGMYTWHHRWTTRKNAVAAAVAVPRKI